MVTDSELLRAYADEKSESAFGELVRRQVNLVYSVALRQCGGDAHLAEDVAQRVFTDLARKARQLSGYAVLGGWLYRSTQFAASDVVRAERRRRAREQEASAMHETFSTQPGSVGGDADWQKLAPVLDQAIGELAAPDRDAVVLRFFEGRPFAEIGATLRLTEDAARMRVERALDKLRVALVRRGITSTTAALGIALANQAAATAPAGVAASVTSAALTAAAVGGIGFAAFFMNMTTLQIAAAVTILAIAATGFLAQARTSAELRTEIAVLQEQERNFPRLHNENQALLRTATENAMLRVDGTELARLREEVAVARRTQARSAARPGPTFTSLPPLKNPDEKVSLRLPDADLETTLTTLKVLSGWQLVRDASLGRGIVTVRTAGPVTKTQVLELLRTALRDQAGIVLEPGPDGTVLVKRAAGR